MGLIDFVKEAGEKLAGMGGSKAICVNQEVGNVALDLRCEGFASTLQAVHDGQNALHLQSGCLDVLDST